MSTQRARVLNLSIDSRSDVGRHSFGVIDSSAKQDIVLNRISARGIDPSTLFVSYSMAIFSYVISLVQNYGKICVNGIFTTYRPDHHSLSPVQSLTKK